MIDVVVPSMFNRVLLATYAPQHHRLIAVYCDPESVYSFLFDNYKLNDNNVQEVAAVVERFVKVSIPREKIVLNYAITDTEYVTHLLENFQFVKMKGSNLKSSGVYVLSTALEIQYEEDIKSPHHYIADYFAGLLHHNAQTCTSYLETLPVPHSEKIKDAIAQCFTNNSFNPCKLNCMNNKFSIQPSRI